MSDDAREEAERFRWIESEKAGYDLGEEAVRRWVGLHWPAFVRGRALGHLAGTRFWLAMARADFGALPRAFPGQPELVREVVARLAAGADNVSVLQWAMDAAAPVDDVRDILQAVDVSALRTRFPPPDDADPPYIVHG